jgi:hypothetical protein
MIFASFAPAARTSRPNPGEHPNQPIGHFNLADADIALIDATISTRRSPCRELQQIAFG